VDIDAIQAELEKCPQLAGLLAQLVDEFLKNGASSQYMAMLEVIGQVVGRI
jgi:hypothetical protein